MTGAGTEGGALPALPLAEVLRAHRLRPAAAVAVTADVLHALRVLHDSGRCHGAIDAAGVLVSPTGALRLTGSRNLESDPQLRGADIRATGRLLCQLLRIPLEASSRRRQPEIATTELGRFAIKLATQTRKSKAPNPAAQAHLGLWEAAGVLAGSRRQADARRKLGLLVAGITMPARPVEAAKRVEPAAEQVATARPVSQPVPGRRRWRRPAALLAVAVLALLLGAIAILVALPGLSRRPAPARPAAPSMVATAAVPAPVEAPPAAAPAPAPRPALPLADGDVAGVALQGSGCGPGGSCLVSVDVQIAPAAAARAVTWRVEAVNTCTGEATTLAVATVIAQPRWTHVTGSNSISLPAGRNAIRAVTETPGRAASPVSSLGVGC